jgi:hypothetical protein
MAYQHLTWGALKTLAHKRVGAAAFFTEAEMELYLAEALKVWNLLTGHFRGTSNVATTASTIFYDSALHAQTTTDQNVLNEIQYHTLETPDDGASLDSDMWTIGEWVDYLNARAAHFTAETKLILTRDSSLASVIDQSQYDLGSGVDTDLLEVHRVAWLDASGTSHGLLQDSTLTYDRLLPTWPKAAASQEPEVWVRQGRAQLKIRILPAPSEAGTFDILYTKRPAQLPQTPDGTTFDLPVDFVPYVKYGAMADIFSKEGQANDPVKAAYCEQRYKEGILIARFVLAQQTSRRIEFNANPLDFETLESLDLGADGWQADTFNSIPVDWFPVGLTQFGVHPPHGGGGTLNVDGLKDAVIPSADGQFPDIPHSDVERILDYAHHLAAFKMGGAEFEAGQEKLANFMDATRDSELRKQLASLYEPKAGADAPIDETLINAS